VRPTTRTRCRRCSSAPTTRPLTAAAWPRCRRWARSGGLKVGARLHQALVPAAQVWVSDPTWDNHRAMFEGAGSP
jgi:aromatic-amino-acid transaminase